MLKNKKAIYVLIPLNILIWGFFIYRFYTAFNEGEVPVNDQKTGVVKLEALKDSVAYKLSLDYKDPFLRDVSRAENHNLSYNPSVKAKPKVEKITVKTPTVQPKVLPDIKYMGLIKNSSSGASTALVSINGQSKLVKVGETVDGIMFKSFDNNELVAVWGKEKIVVRK